MYDAARNAPGCEALVLVEEAGDGALDAEVSDTPTLAVAKRLMPRTAAAEAPDVRMIILLADASA